jgi:hypothetical protein
VADPPSYPDEGDGTNGEPTAGTPLWVKVFGAIAFGVVLLFVVLLLTGRGHGPGRHGGQAPPSSLKSAGSAADHTTPSGRAHQEQRP